MTPLSSDRRAAVAVVAAVLVAVVLAKAEQLASPRAAADAPAAAQAASPPGAQRVADAERALAAQPRSAERHTTLAMALARRARDTANSDDYERADKALDEALRLAPGDFEALKARAWVRLGQHRFVDALALARTLNARMPDDVLVYGLLTDAYVELGQYEEAEAACQWMLDLRPGNVPAFTRAAHLREVFGDIEGAAELMGAAYTRLSPTEVEDRSWVLTHLAHLARLAGKPDDAERLLQEALALVPQYHYALAELARLRTAQGRHRDAAALLRARYNAAPHPENLFDLARALERAGETDQARPLFEQFEQQALAESASWDNANRELITYYIEHAGKPADALRIGKLESDRRQDVDTLSAWAWALHANGRTREARDVMTRTLAVGTKDPDIRTRASAIGLTR